MHQIQYVPALSTNIRNNLYQFFAINKKKRKDKHSSISYKNCYKFCSHVSLANIEICLDRKICLIMIKRSKKLIFNLTFIFLFVKFGSFNDS